jgi:hypothetical protein
MDEERGHLLHPLYVFAPSGLPTLLAEPHALLLLLHSLQQQYFLRQQHETVAAKRPHDES